MSTAIQVLLLDLDDAISIEDIAPHLPAGRPQLHPLKLSEYGAEGITRPGKERGQVPWETIGQAVVRLVATARSTRPAGTQPEYWIAGRAPLPVFTHLGAELSGWTTPPVVVNRRKDGQWDVVRTASAATDAGHSFFDIRSGLPNPSSETTGRVAVFVSTLGFEPQRDSIRGFVVGRGDDLGAIVELRTTNTAMLTEHNAPTAGRELAQLFSQLPGAFPHASGLVLLVAGPAHLAVLAGRAVNANMVRDVLIPNFRVGDYEEAIRLPWRGASPQPIGDSPEDDAERRTVLGHLCNGMAATQQVAKEDDVPRFVPRAEARDLLENLRRVVLTREPEGTAFELNILQGRLSIGTGLLEALRGKSATELQHIGAALLLHEVRHFDQNIRSTNYREVGRAGVALEDVDYWADATAIGTLARLAGRDKVSPRDVLVELVTAHIRCMEAFDRAEQGTAHLEQLAERRLRRYLMWHLQLCRAKTIAELAHIDELLELRPVVELAPLRGSLDSRYDKVVSAGTSTTELFVVLRGRLLRFPARPAFQPANLVNAVRTFDWTAPQAAMDYVVGEHSATLVPWVGNRRSG